MDGNREQAVKAKILAQNKMEKKDFVSALGLAVKAKQLYPDLENISDIILVCDVICSANKKVNGNENDWYSILKLDSTADEATIKKQYRKFALTLHPDKNKLTGASDAFSLISQAQSALLDRNTRLAYDKKLQAANVRRGIYQAYAQSDVKRQPPYQKSCANKFASKFNNQQQQQKSQSANDRSTFWTSCPHCSNLFMYYRNIIGKKVACQNCKLNFTTLENKSCPSLPTGWSQPNSTQREETGIDSLKQTSQSGGTIYTKVELKKDTGINYFRHASESGPKISYSKVELNKHASDKRKSGSQNGFTTVTTEASKSKGEYPNVESTIQDSNHLGEPNSEIHKKTVATEASKSKGEYPNVESTIQDSNHLGEPNSEIHKKTVATEASKSKGEYPNVESTIQDSNHLGEPNSEIHKKTVATEASKSKGEYPNVESTIQDSNHLGEPNRKIHKKRKMEKSGSDEEKQNSENANHVTQHKFGSSHVENVQDYEAGLCMNTEGNQINIKGRERYLSKDITQRGEKDAEKEFHKYPDSEFNNFDNLRAKDNFRKGQIWAVYDSLDALPRFYAIVTDVFSPDFKVELTWLEPYPDNEEELKWIEEGFPVSCGKFRCGNSDIIKDIEMFSHLIYGEKSSGEGTYEVHPRRGETWALFKDWDINWYAHSETKKRYAYEFVEVVSDYSTAEGVHVAFLTKLEGLSCIFSTERKEASSVLIPAKEKFRFSHVVPSFKITEKDGNNLVNASFELDPASLPTANEDGSVFLDVSSEVDKEMHPPSNLYFKPSVDQAVNKKAKFEGFAVNEDIESSRKLDVPVAGFHTVEGKQRVISSLQDMMEVHVDSIENQNLASNLQFDMEAICAHMPKSSCNATSASNQVATQPAIKFYNFYQDKSPNKFQTGQIWATYNNGATVPIHYGKIKKIDPFPAFTVYVAWLHTCSPEGKKSSVSKAMPMGCGSFKVRPGRASRYINTDLFSHQVKAEPSVKKDVYAIFPKKGEIWALYRDCKNGLNDNDLTCEIVEVMEENEHFLTVSVLERVEGFRSVFRPRVDGGPYGGQEIYRTELYRFSHQIPAYQLTEENGGHLHGLWELDGAALQNYPLHL